MSEFRAIVSIGFDKNGEADFRVSMAIAEVDRPKMEELTRMMPWAIKEALSLWLDHGPPSKEQQAASAVTNGEGK
jgi:hypothetical protein